MFRYGTIFGCLSALAVVRGVRFRWKGLGEGGGDGRQHGHEGVSLAAGPAQAALDVLEGGGAAGLELKLLAVRIDRRVRRGQLLGAQDALDADVLPAGWGEEGSAEGSKLGAVYPLQIEDEGRRGIHGGRAQARPAGCGGAAAAAAPPFGARARTTLPAACGLCMLHAPTSSAFLERIDRQIRGEARRAL